MTNFEQAFQLTVGFEQGYVNDPKDPGGETKFGISKRSHPSEDIANMTLDRAKEIYLRDYWKPLGCELMPIPVSLCVFDAGVNCGIGRAAKWLQEAVGADADGKVGPKTIAAIGGYDPRLVGVMVCASRLLYCASLPGWQTFGKGWAKRIALLIQSL